jgi:hypothetical protein
VELVKETTTHAQLLEWQVWLNKYEPNEFHRTDAYLNEILLVLYKKLNPQKAKRLKAGDFQITFKQKPKTKTGYSWRESKAMWGLALGITPSDV